MEFKKRARKKSVWSNAFYLKGYQLACQGLTDYQIAQGLKITPTALRAWKKSNKIFRDGLNEGRKGNSPKSATSTFKDYVYGQLPDDLKEKWDQIGDFEKQKNGIRRVQALLANEGEDTLKHLFIHALCVLNFNPSKACKKVAIQYHTLQRWVVEDPDFQRLVDEVQFHKKNFVEDKLMELVRDKDPGIVWNVNKSLNKDRGYGDKVEIEHTGQVNHTVKQELDISKFSFKLQKMILDEMNALQKVEDQRLLEDLSQDSN